MNIPIKIKLAFVGVFLLGLASMYGAWQVTDYVQEAEAAKDTVELAENQMDTVKQEVEKQEAKVVELENKIKDLKAQALANNVFLK